MDSDSCDRYSIIRHYMSASVRRRTIATGLTLEQAQAHCADPETSSITACKSAARQRTKRLGQWFDGYQKN